MKKATVEGLRPPKSGEKEYRVKSLIQENKDLKLENYQLREELMRLEAKLARAFNELMVFTGQRTG